MLHFVLQDKTVNAVVYYYLPLMAEKFVTQARKAKLRLSVVENQ